MVMVAVPVPGPPQVPGAVGQTSAAPDSWMVKVAVLGSARAPPAVMTVPTALRAIVMTAMMTSRLPIELLLRWAGRRYPAAANSNGRPDELVTVRPDTTSSASNAPGNVSSLTEPVPAQRPPCQARTLGGELQADRDDSPRAGGDQRGEDGWAAGSVPLARLSGTCTPRTDPSTPDIAAGAVVGGSPLATRSGVGFAFPSCSRRVPRRRRPWTRCWSGSPTPASPTPASPGPPQPAGASSRCGLGPTAATAGRHSAPTSQPGRPPLGDGSTAPRGPQPGPCLRRAPTAPWRTARRWLGPRPAGRSGPVRTPATGCRRAPRVRRL